MTDFTHPEAKLFAAAIAKGGKAAERARQEIALPALKHEPELRQAVDEDCRALCEAAAKLRGYADLADLTRAGYPEPFALHQAEIIAAQRRQDARRKVA